MRKINALQKITLLIFALIIYSSCNNPKTTSQIVFENLQKEYGFSETLKKFRVKYKSISPFSHQSYDYKHPEDPINGYNTSTTEIDLENEQFYSHNKGFYPGEFLFEFFHFQKDSLVISYDVNGVLIGKQVEVGEDTFSNVKKRATSFLDFTNVSDLLTYQKQGDSIETILSKEKNEAVIKHMDKDSSINIYTFKMNPTQLLSIESKAKNTKTVFSNYKDVNGISFAHSVDVYRSDNLQRQYVIEELNKITKVDPNKLVIPEGYIVPNKEKVQEQSKVIEIAKNLYLITTPDGGRNMLFKVTDKSITVFGAPISDKVSKNVISLIEDKFPNKNIDYVYVTHSHHDHIGGLNAYAQQNVTILADSYTIEAIKAYPRFEKDINKFKFSPIRHNQILNDVQFFIPKNSHSLGQSFAYFTDSQIIYEGDFLEVPFDNTIPTYMSKVEKEFVEFVRKEKLKIKRIVGNHRNANISLETMNAYYDSNTTKK
ncbi:MBL fold metallo-hydrolase [Aquimarina sediminis]|uniref:MBL fold metallo-hydrolase n=1 Tax=Aquimarina sediminis TaxID=2070536 RepID=UPI000CA08F04|nr:MBL fold metallo-hydrolase [Aquimarina sediminis]